MSTYEEILKKDPKMGELVDILGPLEKPKMTSDLLKDVLETIVSQQLSVKAASTIWSRFEKLVGSVVPGNPILFDAGALRSVGVSLQKSKYIADTCSHFASGEIDQSHLASLSDEEVISKLTKIKGIGRWSSEMILMFSLGREDVFSLGDLGLKTAVSRLYGVERDDLVAIEKISRAWSPFRSYASRYLWKSLDNEPKIKP